MAKHMLLSNGKLVKVDKQTAAKMYSEGSARYLSKDEYRRKVAQQESANGKG